MLEHVEVTVRNHWRSCAAAHLKPVEAAAGRGLQPEPGKGGVDDLAVGRRDEPDAARVVPVLVPRVREGQGAGRLQPTPAG